MANLKAEFLGIGQVLLNVALRIEDNGGRTGLVSEQIGCLGQTAQVILFQNHKRPHIVRRHCADLCPPRCSSISNTSVRSVRPLTHTRPIHPDARNTDLLARSAFLPPEKARQRRTRCCIQRAQAVCQACGPSSALGCLRQACLPRTSASAALSRRYTHHVAISNHRLLAFDRERATFRWRDYALGNKSRVMTLEAVEFLRRSSYTYFPRGSSVFGISDCWLTVFEQSRLSLCRQLLSVVPPGSISLAPSDSAST
jgi:Putative transposase